MKRPNCMSHGSLWRRWWVKRLLWRMAVSKCTCRVLCRDLQRSVEKQRGREVWEATTLMKNNAPPSHFLGQLQKTELMVLQPLLKNKFLCLNFFSAQDGLNYWIMFFIFTWIQAWILFILESKPAPPESPGFNHITLVLSLTALGSLILFWTPEETAKDFRILIC